MLSPPMEIHSSFFLLLYHNCLSGVAVVYHCRVYPNISSAVLQHPHSGPVASAPVRSSGMPADCSCRQRLLFHRLQQLFRGYRSAYSNLPVAPAISDLHCFRSAAQKKVSPHYRHNGYSSNWLSAHSYLPWPCRQRSRTEII